MNLLDGKKTYITAALLAVVAAARFLGYLTPEMASTIETLLLGGGLAFLRAGIAKS